MRHVDSPSMHCGTTHQRRLLGAALLVSFLAACASPQERAINDYCSAQAKAAVPARMEQRQVEREVKVGERFDGWAKECKTVKKHNRTIEECTQKPIKKPILRRQMVIEEVDANTAARRANYQACRANALKGGMFKELGK